MKCLASPTSKTLPRNHLILQLSQTPTGSEDESGNDSDNHPSDDDDHQPGPAEPEEGDASLSSGTDTGGGANEPNNHDNQDQDQHSFDDQDFDDVEEVDNVIPATEAFQTVWRNFMAKAKAEAERVTSGLDEQGNKNVEQPPAGTPRSKEKFAERYLESVHEGP